jgi:hypothetical protein
MVVGNKSHGLLQANIQELFLNKLLCDVVLISEDKHEVPVHRAILAAHSEYFRTKLMGSQKGGQGMIEMHLQCQAPILHHLMKFLYFGDFDEQMTPEMALGVLKEARGYGIAALRAEDVAPIIVSQLNYHNCLTVLLHPELEQHDAIASKVCEHVGRSMLELLINETCFQKLLHCSRRMMIQLIGIVCKICTSQKDADLVVRFLTDWAQVESACDLLKECKQWHWSSGEEMTPMRERLEDTESSHEWHISNVKSLLSDAAMPVRFVQGTYFDWCVRIDHGSEGKLRIVYESATETSQCPDLCLMRFPAAMFAWQVIYKGTNVFHERPVFICFPQNVSLHWSTTLPVSAAELAEDDEITIVCQMIENPLVSLILYHFSSDLVTTVKNEDILNRLPHIEFRCVSSYMLFKQHLEVA